MAHCSDSVCRSGPAPEGSASEWWSDASDAFDVGLDEDELDEAEARADGVQLHFSIEPMGSQKQLDDK